MKQNVIALIPAYKPTESLIAIVRGLVLSKKFTHIICVNDGSGHSFDSLFEKVAKVDETQVSLLKHAVNLGKGSALKTGFNYIALNFTDSIGVVTLDADGQHRVEDCCNVADALIENQDSLILGVRTFDSNKVPLRSRFGNVMTAKILKLFTSIDLADTQTGLRGIPLYLLKDLLRLNTGGYEFELDMLMLANSKKVGIVQTPIETVYIDNNSSSHFNPFLDSFKIYMIFFRFIASSLFTFVIDYLVFFLAMLFGFGIGGSILFARIVAGTFNYVVNKNFVFKVDTNNQKTLPLYIVTVILLAICAYLFVIGFVELFGISVLTAKVVAELILYFTSFMIQKNIVFNNDSTLRDKLTFMNKKSADGQAVTDWDDFYKERSVFSKITAKIAFLNFRKKINPFLNSNKTIIELGGGNSIFYPSYRKYYPQAELYLLDQCLPTEKFCNEIKNDNKVYTVKTDILREEVDLYEKGDLVLSFGLIEHFSENDTAKMIEKHFKYAKSGAIVFISFPTPTKRYLFTRFILELVNKWPFYDERPLLFAEVEKEASKHGVLLEKTLCHRFGLSQGVVIYRKNVE